MNTRSHPQIRRFLYGLLLLMIILSVLGVNSTPPARAQEAWTATPTASADTEEVKETVNELPLATETPTSIPTAEVIESQGQSQNVDDTQQIVFAALQKISQFPEAIIAGYQPFGAQVINIEENWSLVTLESYPIEINPEVGISDPNVLFGIGRINENGMWEVYIEKYETAFYDLIALVPDEILSPNAKEIIGHQNDVSSLANTILGLPWPIGNSWRYNQSPHGGSQGALDFGTPTIGVSATVHAADTGVVFYRYQTCIATRRSDGVELWYQHIDANAISTWSVGNVINYTNPIGNTTISSGCNGTSGGHHVHFFIKRDGQYINIYEWSINGFTLSGNNLVRGSTVVQPGINQTLLHTGGTSCPTVSGEVKLYDLTNCGGSSTTAGGTGLWSMVTSFNDKAESIAVPSGWSARLYLHDSESSPSACFNSTDANLGDNTFSDGTNVANQATWMRVYNQSSCPSGSSVPGAASLSSPSGYIGANYIPTYTWNQVSGSTWYYLWVNGPSGNVIKKWYTSAQANCNGSTCSVKHGTVLSGGAHTWWIQTWNDSGYGPWSAAKTFSTASPMPIPGAATLVSPSGGSGWGSQPTFTWYQVNGATWYQLWINNSSGTFYTKWYTSAQVNCNGYSCSITGISLPSGYKRWWVQTWNPSGYGPWSNGIVFYP